MWFQRIFIINANRGWRGPKTVALTLGIRAKVGEKMEKNNADGFPFIFNNFAIPWVENKGLISSRPWPS